MLCGTGNNLAFQTYTGDNIDDNIDALVWRGPGTQPVRQCVIPTSGPAC